MRPNTALRFMRCCFLKPPTTFLGVRAALSLVRRRLSAGNELAVEVAATLSKMDRQRSTTTDWKVKRPMGSTFIASAVVLATGIFWGVYWVPVREIAKLGLNGAWGTAAITLAAALFLLPYVLANRTSLRGKDIIGIIAIAFGGAAFALYSIGFLYGKVALVVLL